MMFLLVRAVPPPPHRTHRQVKQHALTAYLLHPELSLLGGSTSRRPSRYHAVLSAGENCVCTLINKQRRHVCNKSTTNTKCHQLECQGVCRGSCSASLNKRMHDTTHYISNTPVNASRSAAWRQWSRVKLQLPSEGAGGNVIAANNRPLATWLMCTAPGSSVAGKQRLAASQDLVCRRHTQISKTFHIVLWQWVLRYEGSMCQGR